MDVNVSVIQIFRPYVYRLVMMSWGGCFLLFFCPTTFVCMQLSAVRNVCFFEGRATNGGAKAGPVLLSNQTFGSLTQKGFAPSVYSVFSWAGY